MTNEYTLIYIKRIDTGDILLGYKRRGFGAHLYHGYGGKLERHESPKQCAVRELEEESGICITDGALRYLGYTVHRERGEPTRVVYLYTVPVDTLTVSFEPRETEEMTPTWFRYDEIPYDDMLPDNRHYLPLVLTDSRFVAQFQLDKNKNVIGKEIKVYSKDDRIPDFVK